MLSRTSDGLMTSYPVHFCFWRQDVFSLSTKKSSKSLQFWPPLKITSKPTWKYPIQVEIEIYQPKVEHSLFGVQNLIADVQEYCMQLHIFKTSFWNSSPFLYWRILDQLWPWYVGLHSASQDVKTWKGLFGGVVQRSDFCVHSHHSGDNLKLPIWFVSLSSFDMSSEGIVQSIMLDSITNAIVEGPNSFMRLMYTLLLQSYFVQRMSKAKIKGEVSVCQVILPEAKSSFAATNQSTACTLIMAQIMLVYKLYILVKVGTRVCQFLPVCAFEKKTVGYIEVLLTIRMDTVLFSCSDLSLFTLSFDPKEHKNYRSKWWVKVHLIN